MPDAVPVNLARRGRPWANDAHLPPEHVPQLRQLVETGAAQPTAGLGDARVVGDLEGGSVDFGEVFQVPETLFGVGHHGPELQAGEHAAVQADSPLSEKGRPAVDSAYVGGDSEEQWAQRQHQNRADDDVQRPLTNHPKESVRTVKEGDDGESRDLLVAATAEQATQRRDRDADDLAFLFTDACHWFHITPVARREADPDLVDDVAPQDGFEIVDLTQDAANRKALPPLGSQMTDDVQA